MRGDQFWNDVIALGSMIIIFRLVSYVNVLAFNCLLQQCEMWSNVNCVLHFAYVNSLLIGTVADN